ncbi:uncharacterized protein LOC126672624 [Mercurialis annua]|uniref:uncharacterized protein LOC126672624 n=1 Tax=Mercurialis annua TaxID=3986 RepID=UPI00215F83AD|nr:uncharacterized protein LOC126672624 [Mercurialis annua]
MNPLKCAFGVSAGNFLGLLVLQRGVEVDKNKAKAIINAEPPKSKKQLPQLIGQINFLRRFISNTAGRFRSWSVLLRGNEADHFVWTIEQQQVFDELKRYLARPPIMMPLKPNQPLLLCISAANQSLGSILAQEDQGVERSVYYLSRALSDKETRYSDIEKLCLCLYFICCKLRYYMLLVVVYVLSQTDKAIKGQVMADFLADHPRNEIPEDIACFEMNPWRLWFDGSRNGKGDGAGIVIVSPSGAHYKMSCSLKFKCTNNQAKYEALILGLEILVELGGKGDSCLGRFDVGNQASSWRIQIGYKPYYEYGVIQKDTPKLHTGDSDTLRTIHSVYQLDFSTDWRSEILKWFKSPNMADRRLQTLALNYVVLAGELYKKGSDGLLFRCISPKEAMLVMAKVHEGLAGAHQAGPRMRWLVHKYGFYWQKMEQDFIRYSKGCEACQKCGPVQHVPAEILRSFVKPWPFRGWEVDLIG